MVQEQIKRTNVVIIADREKTEKYIYSIVSRMQPEIYNLPEHRCIKLWVKNSLLEYAWEIVNKMRYCGLIVKAKIRKEMDNGTYILPDAWEIVLEKINILEMISEEKGGN